MLGTLVTVLIILAIAYVILWSMKDNPSIGPIFEAFDSGIKKLWETVSSGLSKLASFLSREKK